jgi:hypothetical protein
MSISVCPWQSNWFLSCHTENDDENGTSCSEMAAKWLGWKCINFATWGRISRLSVTKVKSFKLMWLKNGFILYLLKRGTGSSLKAYVDWFTFVLDVARHLSDTPTCSISYSQLGSHKNSVQYALCGTTVVLKCTFCTQVAIKWSHVCLD